MGAHDPAFVSSVPTVQLNTVWHSIQYLKHAQCAITIISTHHNITIYSHPAYGCVWSSDIRNSGMVMFAFIPNWYGDGTCHMELYIHHIRETVNSPNYYDYNTTHHVF